MNTHIFVIPIFAGNFQSAAWNAVGVCPYVVGDANCNGEARGSDITHLVAYLKQQGPPPQDSLSCSISD
jgi:hypothetical protein